MQVNHKELENEIKKHFACDKRRVFFITCLIISLITICSVSYSALSLVLNPLVKKASNFKRIQRFFKKFKVSHGAYIQFVWSILNQHYGSHKFILAIDRTNWQFGVLDINILMIAVIYNGTAIPLVWRLLPKKGNSNQQERIDLLSELRELLSDEQWSQICCITMDREFEGQKWLKFLQQKGLHFVLRVKKSTLVKKASKSSKIWQLFECNYYRVLRKKRQVFGLSLYVSGQRIISEKGKVDYVIFVSDLAGAKAATYYGERWGIEVLFGDLKSRGFNFEDTHVTNLKSIKLMVLFLSLAYIWAIKTGEWLVEKGYKIPIKMVNGQLRKAYSIFRVGLDHLRIKLIHNMDISDLILLLSCT